MLRRGRRGAGGGGDEAVDRLADIHVAPEVDLIDGLHPWLALAARIGDRGAFLADKLVEACDIARSDCACVCRGRVDGRGGTGEEFFGIARLIDTLVVDVAGDVGVVLAGSEIAGALGADG